MDDESAYKFTNQWVELQLAKNKIEKKEQKLKSEVLREENGWEVLAMAKAKALRKISQQ